MWGLTAFARLSPRESAPEELVSAVTFLDVDADPETIAAGADGVGIVVGVLGVTTALLLEEPVGIVAGLTLAFGAVLTVRGIPRVLASARRTRALGEAPGLVSRAVLRVRLTPTAEGAADFATERDGVLARRLAEHVRAARGTPRSGLGDFAEAWRTTFPALHRAILLIEAAADAPEEDRDRILDRAMDAALDGTRDRAATATDALRGPATALYAFGVLLPLALVGVLPAAGAAGIETTLTVVVLVYDVSLPIVLLGATGWLLANRPVAFSPPAIGRDHPDVPEGRTTAFVAGISGGFGGWLLAGFLAIPWARPLAAIGAGVGAALVIHYRPIVAARRRVDDLEAVLPDALYLVGRRVADGISVERAIVDAAGELESPARDVFEDAARRVRQLRVDVETAFTGDYGALEAFPSPRAESAATMLGIAAHEGAPAGRTLVETADHLDDLRRIEREARRDLSQVTATLANTAAIFGPLVGGATVALADAVDGGGDLGGSVPSTGELGVAIGVYVLILATVLTTLSVGLSRGFDRATVGYRVGAALLSSTTIYLVSFLAANALSGGL